MSTFVAIAMAIAFAPQASAQGAIEIAGRTAITGVFSVISSRPDKGGDSDTVLLGTTITRTTPNARWEYGGGFSILASYNDFADVYAVTPTGQFRINSNFMGPEENILLFAGAVAGITFIQTRTSGLGTQSDTLFVIGPKFGAEFYFAPNAAIQLEDTVLIDSDSGVTNNMTIGFKFLF